MDQMREAQRALETPLFSGLPGDIEVSFEFFPPKTSAGVNNLYTRMERMATLEPAFVDVTWGAGGSTRDLTIEIAANAQKFCGVEVSASQLLRILH